MWQLYSLEHVQSHATLTNIHVVCVQDATICYATNVHTHRTIWRFAPTGEPRSICFPIGISPRWLIPFFPTPLLAVSLYLWGHECQLTIPGSAAAAGSSILPHLCLNKAKSQKITDLVKCWNVNKWQRIVTLEGLKMSLSQPPVNNPIKIKSFFQKSWTSVFCWIFNPPRLAKHFAISPSLLPLSPSSCLESLVSKWNGFYFSFFRLLLCWSSHPSPSNKALTASSPLSLLPCNVRVEVPAGSLTWFCGLQKTIQVDLVGIKC